MQSWLCIIFLLLQLFHHLSLEIKTENVIKPWRFKVSKGSNYPFDHVEGRDTVEGILFL